MRKWLIYTLADPRTPEDIRYVGVTHKGAKGRLRDHVRQAERGVRRTHSSCWVRSLLKEGLEPIMAVVQEGAGAHWNDAEVAWIAWCRKQGFRLTNHTDGGEGTPGFSPSAESRQKMAQAKLGKPRSPEAVARAIATMADPEYRKRHSEAHIGQRPSKETLDRRSASMRGRKQTPEHVAKRAAANRGKTRSPEVREKFSSMRKGVPANPDAVKKRAASNRGKKRSEEFRAKMSILAREREERKRKAREAS